MNGKKRIVAKIVGVALAVATFVGAAGVDPALAAQWSGTTGSVGPRSVSSQLPFYVECDGPTRAGQAGTFSWPLTVTVGASGVSGPYGDVVRAYVQLYRWNGSTMATYGSPIYLAQQMVQAGGPTGNLLGLPTVYVRDHGYYQVNLLFIWTQNITNTYLGASVLTFPNAGDYGGYYARSYHDMCQF